VGFIGLDKHKGVHSAFSQR